MAKGDIVSVKSRAPTDTEQDVITWFEEQEGKSIENLESGARQIITLTTTFYGFLFGIIALGKDSFETSLNSAWVIIPVWLAVGLLLGGLIAALGVVMPRRYTYRDASFDDMKKVYSQITATKTRWMQAAFGLFGTGLAVFALLILLLLMARL
jgi:hypothetical protein